MSPAAHWLIDGPQAALRLEGDWRGSVAAAEIDPPPLPGISRVVLQADGLCGWDSHLAARLWRMNTELSGD
ncbi:MAG: hypothetical protein J0M20_11480, partial [Burkholderiales bacterium]|nr:hypothetical protein [Burkholderiales bacterium]